MSTEPDEPRNPADEKVDPKESVKPLSRGPSHDASPGAAEKGEEVKQKPEDLVDEESMESFPASDPPSHTTSRS